MSFLQSHLLTGVDKPVIIHWHNALTLGGTEKMGCLFLKYFKQINDPFCHMVGYRSQGDNEREIYFQDQVGVENMICVDNDEEFINRVKEIKPFIVHRYSAGISEFPLVPRIKENTQHLISTAVFGNQDDSIDISAVIYVSKHVQHLAQQAGTPNHFVVRNPVEGPYTTDNLREEFGISEDAFVFGRIGRDSADIYHPINLEAYAKVETDNTYFVAVNPSERSLSDVRRLGLKNFKVVERTTSEHRLSSFYNTIDVLAHSRTDGECNPANVLESFGHRNPVISHYGFPFNGHIEVIADAGFVLSQNDVDEYARIMQKFIDCELDYDCLSENALKQWNTMSNPKDRAQEQMNIYKSLL
tara:strand:+ start:13361 stop:14431 length:1071 start_codon:yes stop_codon:yes gene_type:complete